jgi:hypothetical protein
MGKPIIEIYQANLIPSMLQKHMLYAASVASQVIDNIYRLRVNKEKVIRVLLLHDIGNIVKMEPTNEMADSLGVNIEVIIENKSALIKEFGPNDHIVSIELARKIGLRDDELDLMDAKIFIKNEETMLSNDYERKIGAYADQRISPDGVRSLLERLLEAKERYRDKPGSSMNNPKTDRLIECAQEIEKQIMSYCKLSPTDINDKSVNPYYKSLETYEI